MSDYQKKLVDEAISLIQSVSLEEIKNNMDLRKRTGREMQVIMNKYIAKGIKTARGFAHHLIKGDSVEDRILLGQFFDQIFLSDPPAPLQLAVFTVIATRIMTKNI